MAEKEQQKKEKSSRSSSSSWSLQSGGYLGEISALCFLHLPPPYLSSFPLLLAGTGSQILLYDVESGRMLNSFHVFDGIRVHGISSSSLDSTYTRVSSTITFKIVVFGEKKVKLFSLQFQMALGSKTQSKVCAQLVLIHLLPRCSNWVLDVCFLKEDYMYSEHEGNSHLAVGLSDNSVCLWDISKSTIVLEVRCPERTLLYSMRLWGSDIKSLRVASGTIYNEVIVWKLVPEQNISPLVTPLDDSSNPLYLSSNKGRIPDQRYGASYLSRLSGHEGSIFRIAWSSDGSRIMSVSDDRSARIWTIGAESIDSANQRVPIDSDIVGRILFGHSARVWDCYISDSLIVTVGEDCTCRVWGMNGNQLTTIKEHVGRGIWRCAYDPRSSLLITAGFDSAIKVHLLDAFLYRGTTEQDRMGKGFGHRTEIFTLSIPNISDQLGLMDSKSEYVRSLHFTKEDTLYVATNHGYLHHVKLPNAANVRWTELVCVSEEVPIVCMDILSRNLSDVSTNMEDWIAVGDGKGNATVVRVVAGVCTPKVDLVFTWSAGPERQLLGTYWCKSLGCSYIFTADPRGKLKLWRIIGPSQSGFVQTRSMQKAHLIAEFTSCYGTRILCMDASSNAQVLVCGDQRGNIVMFPLSKGLLATSTASDVKISPINYFKGAHGISSLTSISLSTLSFNQVEIRSTGSDGCLCYFKYDGDWKSLEFTGMKQVKELSYIESVSANVNSDEDLACGNYAIGFAAADFIIWDLLNEIKVVQVPCGGWRRPHSFLLGDVSESQNCFAFVKDHAIHIHRLWVPASERKQIPHVLHMQYHGREIHSLCFINDGLQISSNENMNMFDRCGSCIATGCEDGTVRLTRYAPDFGDWSASKLLGEHVGGSAVRSICFVSKMYKTTVNGTCVFNGEDRCDFASDDTDNPSLLISVGAKRVLTTWLLKKRRLSNKKDALVDQDLIETDKSSTPSQSASISVSFQWLSTDMPTRFSSTHKTKKTIEKNTGQRQDSSNLEIGPISRFSFTENTELESKSSFVDNSENDWRYLAVTAFLVECIGSRSVVCFIVVACSDATLTLRALLLPYRLWFDVALLVPQKAPILSLQHLILPTRTSSKDNIQTGCAYILISGSTDGSITFWDLTESVESFMQRILKFQPEKFIECQTRPRTGRGSQGGRWWRTLRNRYSKANPKNAGPIDSTQVINGQKPELAACKAPYKFNDSTNTESKVVCRQTMDTACISESEEGLGVSPSEICVIQPFHVLDNVHLSGVNCLHVSNVRNFHNAESSICSYNVLSGGDDQALHCLTFDLVLSLVGDGSENKMHSDNTNHIGDLGNVGSRSLSSKNKRCRIRILSHDKIASAHSSAVKGVWTDGTWAFSTGLDQRIRCWNLTEQGKLTECAHLVISVPEPESLDARACGRHEYQIAVAGRGMQMVNFFAPYEMDGQG